eukprot:9491592-Pyramimonas_sp.AAC.1
MHAVTIPAGTQHICASGKLKTLIVGKLSMLVFIGSNINSAGVNAAREFNSLSRQHGHLPRVMALQRLLCVSGAVNFSAVCRRLGDSRLRASAVATTNHRPPREGAHNFPGRARVPGAAGKGCAGPCVGGDAFMSLGHPLLALLGGRENEAAAEAITFVCAGGAPRAAFRRGIVGSRLRRARTLADAIATFFLDQAVDDAVSMMVSATIGHWHRSDRLVGRNEMTRALPAGAPPNCERDSGGVGA